MCQRLRGLCVGMVVDIRGLGVGVYMCNHISSQKQTVRKTFLSEMKWFKQKKTSNIVKLSL